MFLTGRLPGASLSYQCFYLIYWQWKLESKQLCQVRIVGLRLGKQESFAQSRMLAQGLGLSVSFCIWFLEGKNEAWILTSEQKTRPWIQCVRKHDHELVTKESCGSKKVVNLRSTSTTWAGHLNALMPHFGIISVSLIRIRWEQRGLDRKGHLTTDIDGKQSWTLFPISEALPLKA